jgi:integrase
MTKTFNHYHRRGNINSKPYFELPKVGDNMRDRILTEMEILELLRLFEEVWDIQPRRSDGQVGQAWADWTVFLLDTGCRPSEGRVAEVKNLNGRLLTLTKTKTKQRRTIPLTDRALEAFERQAFGDQKVPFAYATSDAYRAAWDWARSIMNLSDDAGFIPYALRHTCATRLYDKTRDLMIVQRWLGHTDIKMTLRYAKLMPGDLERACDLMQGAPKLQAVRDASGDA